MANDQREEIRQAGRGLALAHAGRKPVRVVAVARANRRARIVRALLKTGDGYRAAAAGTETAGVRSGIETVRRDVR